MAEITPIKPRKLATTDGYANLASRLGTPGDKSYFGKYIYQPLDQADLEGAYRTSWLGKIIDIKAEDTFREWRTWQGDKDQISEIEGLETSLNLRGAYLEADRLAMIYGGAVAFLGGLPGSLDSAVNLDAVKLGSLKYVTVMDRWDVTVGEMETDPAAAGYGMPKYYSLGAQQVHPSRVVRFIGRQKPNMRREWDGWGDPIWASLRDAVKNTDAVTAGISALVQEAKLDVISIPGLSQKISTQEFEDILVKRFNTQLMLKSIINALLLDGGNGDGKTGEIHTTKTQAFAGLPDITDRFLMILCAMADIPATRLLGRSPQGMNSTGESDEKNYAVMVKARQDLKITPVTRFADEIVVRSALGMMPKGMWYSWNELYTTSEKDAATVEKTYADAFVARMGTGAIDDAVLAKSELNRMIETGRYPGIEDAISESETEDGLVDPDEKEAKELARMQAEAEIAAAGKPKLVAANDAVPRTLYVRRDVVNAKAIRAHYTAQGVDVMPAEKMHVTVIYSKAPIDWFSIGEAWQAEIKLTKGGARDHALFGPPGAEDTLVLMIKSQELEWRHEEFKRHGAQSSYDEYQPHISLSKYGEGASVDMMKLKPWIGPIVLGPEIFEEVKSDA